MRHAKKVEHAVNGGAFLKLRPQLELAGMVSYQGAVLVGEAVRSADLNYVTSYDTGMKIACMLAASLQLLNLKPSTSACMEVYQRCLIDPVLSSLSLLPIHITLNDHHALEQAKYSSTLCRH